MTIDACMRLVDELMPNRIPREVKRRLLGEVEGKVRVELLGEEPHAVPVLDEDTSMDTELSAPAPYDRLYWQYLLAMLCHIAGDGARYENAAALFNASYLSYGKWLKRRGA
jgi:hypothetical protein